MGISISDIGLFLCAIPVAVHGIEAYYPTLARFIVNVIFPPFGFKIPNNVDIMLSYEEQMEMYKAAISAAPVEKIVAAKDLIFVHLFEARQGAAAFIACAATSYYALTLPLGQRHPVHFLFLIISIFMTLANANHIGFPFGDHPLVSDNGYGIGVAFVPFWFAAAYCNYKALNLSITAMGKKA